MNHYCTYFDSGFLPQGLALWHSLKRYNPDAVLWVLGLDTVVTAALRKLQEPDLRVVALSQLEASDPELAASRSSRSRVEYYFTLSPCWPRWLLAQHSDIERVTYLDADLFFFSAPDPVFAAMDSARASVLITAHRFPDHLRDFERHGRYNVGILIFKNTPAARSVLEDWRARCLEWCYDQIEPDRYADQKYLDAWPARFGNSVMILEHPGVNAAPWNWTNHQWACTERGITVHDAPLVVFHFAAFRRLGRCIWDSGQLDYGVMPPSLRKALYLPYLRALAKMESLLMRLDEQTGARLARRRIKLRRWIPAFCFGSIWWFNGSAVHALGGAWWGKHSASWMARWRSDPAA